MIRCQQDEFGTPHGRCVRTRPRTQRKKMKIPELIQIKQKYEQPRIEDISTEIRRLMENYDLSSRINPGDEIAITAGSRGIANLVPIYRAIVREVKRGGGRPFLVPAMGSHGGGSAEGQKDILNGLGITETTVGAPVRATMDVIEIGRTDHDTPVYVDAYSNRADGIIAVNRIKMHTEQHNTTESGLMKIMAIGLGKQKQAELIHSYGVWGLVNLIPASAKVILARKNIVAGIGIVENALDETAIIEVLPPEDIPEREKLLFKKSQDLYPWLPFRTLDVLVINRIGKNISGTCMDANLIGRMGVWGLEDPEKVYAAGGSEFKSTLIEHIAALNLTDESHGNAIGVGQADIITRKLYEKIDFQATYNNVITSTFLSKGKIPLVAENDRSAIDIALKTLNGLMRLEGKKDETNVKICFIDSSLHGGQMLVSRGLEEELRARNDITFLGGYRPLDFDSHGNLQLALGVHH